MDIAARLLRMRLVEAQKDIILRSPDSFLGTAPDEEGTAEFAVRFVFPLTKIDTTVGRIRSK
jgi:hypothetical protein